MSIAAKTTPEDPIGTRNPSAADIKPLLAKFGTWEEKKITDPDFKCVMPSRISDCRWKVKADLGMRHGASWRLYKSMRLTRER